MFTKELQKIGLTEKQAKIYLALLDMGKTSVQKLAGHTKIKRATTYVILDELMDLGLVSTHQEGKKTLFIAELPERLSSYLENKLQKIDNKEREFNAILSQLNEIHQKSDERPMVEYVEGKKDLKRAIRRVIFAQKKGNIQMFYNNDEIAKYFSEEERGEIRKLRQQRGIKTKVIYTSSDNELLARAKNDKRIRVSAKDFPTSCDITLYDGKVQLASLCEDNPNGIIITNKAIYQSFLSLFRLAWLGAKQKK